MTIPTLAIEALYSAVAARFVAEAAQVSALGSADFGGSASLSGTPTDAAEVVIKIVTGGTVGVIGIVYKVSTDGGATFGANAPLALGTSIAVDGVTATISGTCSTGDVLSWSQTSPIVPVMQFGTREPAKRGDTFRLVFVPGDGANAGEIMPVRSAGENPRALLQLAETLTVYVEGFDATPAHAENELAQWKATRLLFDAFTRAVYLETECAAEVVSSAWERDRSTRRHGYTMRCVLAVQSVIPDEPVTLASANARAVMASTAVIDGTHDQTDTITVSSGDSP